MSACSPVAVIGAGNVGCALAADLALRGVEVRLFNRSPERLAAIADAGGITVTGQIEGFAPLSLVTGSLQQAIGGELNAALAHPEQCGLQAAPELTVLRGSATANSPSTSAA